MLLPPNSISQLIPANPPEQRFVPVEIYERAASIEDFELQRSFLWAHTILRFLFPGNSIPAGLLPKRTVHLSAGFVFVGNQLSNELQRSITVTESFSFGAYALVNSDEKETRSTILPITIGEQVLPLVIQYGRVEPNGCPTHPPGGTGCCWAEDATGKATWSKGIVASRHVVSSYSVGSSITLSPSTTHSSPSSGSLAVIDACTIDAAIIQIDPFYWPTGLRRLSINNAIAPGSTVAQLNGQYTTAAGHVLRIFQYPTYFGNLFGQRVIADCHGIAGDSGTLLMDGTGDGPGIYMGTIPDGAGGRDGLYQDLKQVEDYFDLKLYY
jgi:hypothetical protein